MREKLSHIDIISTERPLCDNTQRRLTSCEVNTCDVPKTLQKLHQIDN